MQKQLIIITDHWKLKEKILPSDHPDMAASFNNIGTVYMACQQYDVAMENHERALNIRIESLPCKHPNIALSYENIGSVHERNGELQKAMVNYKKASDIYCHSLPLQHPNVIEIKKSIKRISSELVLDC